MTGYTEVRVLKLGYCLVGLGSLVWVKRDTPIRIIIVISPVLKL